MYFTGTHGTSIFKS